MTKTQDTTKPWTIRYETVTGYVMSRYFATRERAELALKCGGPLGTAIVRAWVEEVAS